MANEKYTDRYFLTVDGWVLDKNLAQPPDCIQIWDRKVEQGSGFGRESDHWTLSWTSKDITADALAELHQKFPRQVKSKTLSPEALNALSKMMRT